MPLSTRRSFKRRTPRGLFGSIGLMAGPFVVAEFVAHDSRLQFGSFNHVSGSAINPPSPIALPLSPEFTSALDGKRTWPDVRLARPGREMTQITFATKTDVQGACRRVPKVKPRRPEW